MMDDLLQMRKTLEDRINDRRSVLSSAAKNRDVKGDGLTAIALQITRMESEIHGINDVIRYLRGKQHDHQ